MTRPPLSLLACLLLAWLPNAARAQVDETVTVHYILRPPYMEPIGDGLKGLTGEPTIRAFRRANVPFVLQQTPFARQLNLLQSNSGRDCMIGMFHKPEREQFAKFSKPVYRDRPQVILTNAENAERFTRFTSLVDLFADKSMTLLVKLGYSYGQALDPLMAQHKPKTLTTADENLLMLKAIKWNQADYMFIAPEEAQVAITAAGYQPGDFKQIKYADMPLGDFRHIMCSKNVPDEVMRKLNAVIEFTPAKKP